MEISTAKLYTKCMFGGHLMIFCVVNMFITYGHCSETLV